MSEHVRVEDLWSSLDGSAGRERCVNLVALAERLYQDGEFGQALPLVETAADEAESLDDALLRVRSLVLDADRLVRAVAAGRSPEPTGRDGLMAQRLADAATASAQSGKPVRL